jgi:hypothetical protein
MENIVVRRLVAPFAAALVLLIHLAPASAAGQSAQVDQDQPVEVTYTKWVVVQDGIPFLTGFTGGDVVGAFSGQVFVGVTSADGRIRRLEAQYSVDGADRSFSALIRGGGNPATGAAILDGTILAGWRTGAPVHVEFQTIPAPSPTESACYGVPAGVTCFQGTIRIGRVPGQ